MQEMNRREDVLPPRTRVLFWETIQCCPTLLSVCSPPPLPTTTTDRKKEPKSHLDDKIKLAKLVIERRRSVRSNDDLVVDGGLDLDVLADGKTKVRRRLGKGESITVLICLLVCKEGKNQYT